MIFPFSFCILLISVEQDNVWQEWGNKGSDGGESGVKSKKKKKASATAPKKNLSAYILFCQAERAKKNLTGTVREHACELGRRWRVLPEEEKQSFIEKAAVDKARYQEEMIASSSMQEAAVEEEKVEEGVEESDRGQEEEGESTKVKFDIVFNGTTLKSRLQVRRS